MLSINRLCGFPFSKYLSWELQRLQSPNKLAETVVSGVRCKLQYTFLAIWQLQRVAIAGHNNPGEDRIPKPKDVQLLETDECVQLSSMLATSVLPRIGCTRATGHDGGQVR
jgi:hypothetical protein